MQLRYIPPLKIIKTLYLTVAVINVFACSESFAAGENQNIPAWLAVHVGNNEGEIAEVVLQRARALYFLKKDQGAVKNACYFAMDATRPNDLRDGTLGHRFYIICEASRSFRAVPVGHGSGRNLNGVADFANGRQCAKNFSNAMDSELTAGGAYVTAETKSSFKGYYRLSTKQDAILTRSFIQFDGEGEAANARARAIGGHIAITLKGICLRKDPRSPYANRDGYVPFGNLVDYSGGRSNGCTSWSPSDGSQIIDMVKDSPTILYIYPEAKDINAVAHSVATGQSLSRSGLYWNSVCLGEIHAPKFWPKETLEPILALYKKDHPSPPPSPVPICK